MTLKELISTLLEPDLCTDGNPMGMEVSINTAYHSKQHLLSVYTDNNDVVHIDIGEVNG